MPTLSDLDYETLLEKIKHLEAENASLKERLHEYADVASTKQKELQQQEAANIEIRVNFENQYAELQSKKNYISNLLQKEAAAMQRQQELEKQVGGAVSTLNMLDNAKVQHDLLQAQLNDVSERLQQLNNEYILQQQAAGRVAELESLLANAEEEIERLKAPPATDDEVDENN